MAKSIFIILALNLFTLSSWCQVAQSTQFMCANKQNIAGFKTLTTDSTNMLAFANGGGLFNGGVCWWHTRLQQASFYLAVFHPNLPKPDEKETKRLISQLASLRSVVEIPGYSNLHEFSYENWDLIQKKLNSWQLMEGILGFAWIKGLAGHSKLPTAKLRKQLEKIYADVELDKRMAYTKLQLPGIVAHALLVTNMTPTAAGFSVNYIDSNYPQSVGTDYFNDGDETFSWYGGVPYLERHGDFKKIFKAQDGFCKREVNNWSKASEADLDRAIFQDLEQYYLDNLEQYETSF